MFPTGMVSSSLTDSRNSARTTFASLAERDLPVPASTAGGAAMSPSSIPRDSRRHRRSSFGSSADSPISSKVRRSSDSSHRLSFLCRDLPVAACGCDSSANRYCSRKSLQAEAGVEAEAPVPPPPEPCLCLASSNEYATNNWAAVPSSTDYCRVRPAPVSGARRFRSATARDRAVVEEGLVLIVAGMLIVMLTGSRCWWCSWCFDWRMLQYHWTWKRAK